MAITWKKVAFESDVITKALLTTKGDIVYASAASTPARLAIGDDKKFLTVATDVPAWAAQTKTYTWVIASPAVGGIPGPRLKLASTAVRIDSYVTGGTSCTFNIEERGTIASAGTNLLASDQAADVDGATTTSFDNAGLAADCWLWIDISAVSGTVPYVVIVLTVTEP